MPWLDRALELCADHGGTLAGEPTLSSPAARARRAATPRARGATRSSRRPTCATRWSPRASSPRRSRPRSPGTASTSSSRACAARRSRAARGLRRGHRDLPPHPRLSRRRRALLHRARPRAPRLGARAVGRDQGRRVRGDRSPPAARSPTTTPSAATTGPGTTASAPTRSPRRCAPPSAQLDPAAILNPGVLIDPVSERGKRELARADKIQPGLWRLRLPLPWPGVPHVNAFAIAAGQRHRARRHRACTSPARSEQLERALALAGLKLEHVRLLVCTHAHSDHYGLAGPIIDASGARALDAPQPRAHDAARSRTRSARSSGASRLRARAACRSPRSSATASERKGQGIGIARVVLPDRDLLPGRGGRDRPRDVAGVRDARARALARRAPPARAQAAALGRPPASAASRSTTTTAGRPTRRASTWRASTWSSGLDVDLCLAGHGKPVRDAQGPRRGEPRGGARAASAACATRIARRAAHAVRDRARS